MERSLVDDWYDRNKELYQDFTQRMKDLLITLLKGDSVPFHSVEGRLKSKDSYLEKMERKSYEKPEQMMDLTGLRIITQTTVEVQSVCEIIEREFTVDAENSGNKGQDMDVDKVGYLSIHYIVQIDDARAKLPEYRRFEGLRCEIQVRSLLQHAWAEIEHDRSYKFTGVLPLNIRRKFYLIAGTLELMDQEFRSLSHEIDEYAEHVQEETQKGNLDMPIDSTSLLEFLNDFFKEQNPEALKRNYHAKSDELIAELRDFGIHYLQQVKELLQSKSPDEWVIQPSINYIGILRNAMISADAKKYFAEAWQGHWGRTSQVAFDFWRENGLDVDNLKDIVEFLPLQNDATQYRIRKVS